MANRRMFSKSVVDTDPFLELPATAQLLYFHLGMRADDDGFVASPKKIMRMIRSSEDDLKTLIIKGYIIPFESGIILIKHWRQHNFIRKDRYTKTVHIAEFRLIRDGGNGEYCLPTDIPLAIPDGNQSSPDGLPLGDAGQDRLGKDRSGKGREENKSLSVDTVQADGTHFLEFESLYPKRRYEKLAALTAWGEVNPDDDEGVEIVNGLRRWLGSIDWLKDGGRYIPKADKFLRTRRWEERP
jgi:hypothetical protein